MLDPSKVYLFPSAFFRQLLISSMHSGHHIQVSLTSGATVGLEVEPSFMSMNAQLRPTNSLGLSALPYVNEFIKLLDLPLSLN